MIIAVDFDGILAEDTGQFPLIGPPLYPMISFVRELMDMGHEVVLWTSRTDKALDDAVAWCEDRGLHFCTINENAPSNVNKYIADFPNGTRKVSADIYVDDHNPWFIHTVYTKGKKIAMEQTIDEIRRILEWKQEN